MSRYDAIREAACAANKALPANNLVVLTFGNVSAADHALGVFAIKPSGVAYEALTPDQLVIVDFDGKTVEGNLRPSSDTLTHAVLYRHWPGVAGICHTHSTYATAWAQALRDIPVYGTTQADSHAGDIPCAAPMADAHIAGDYERQTGFQVVDCLRERGLSPTQIEMILIGSHAPFTWGATPEKAVYNSVVLEAVARMAFLTEQLNPNTPRLKDALIKKHYDRKHGADAYYGQR